MATSHVDFWVITDAGTVLFSKVADKKGKDQLFGMLMTAMSSFVEEITEEELSHFELSKTKFLIEKKNELFFMIGCAKKEKNRKMQGILEHLMTEFFERYGGDVHEKFDGNVNHFSAFEEIPFFKKEETINKLCDRIESKWRMH